MNNATATTLCGTHTWKFDCGATISVRKVRGKKFCSVACSETLALVSADNFAEAMRVVAEASAVAYIFANVR